jgi:Tfp pilus assembly protein PilZ
LENPVSTTCFGPVDNPRIILAVSDVKRRDVYLSALGTGADLILTDTIRDIPKLLGQGACSGILIDVVLRIKASHMDKVRISDSLEAMPSATLNLDGRNGTVKILMLNKSFGNAGTVSEFIELCGSYQPTQVYPLDLISLRLNAILSKTPEFIPDAEKTITMFISGSGCFLFTPSPEAYEPNSLIWIDFVGIGDRSPVKGRVCWQCPWGVSHKVSGIYVEFEEIFEGQSDEIAGLLAKEKHKPIL